MKRGLLAVLILGALYSGVSNAAEYVFNCKNEWQQDVMIRLHAESIDQGRKMLKTDKELRDKYSIDRTSYCVYRSEIKDENGNSKPMPKKKNNQVVTE